MKSLHRHLLAAVAAASLAACSSVPLDSQAPVESRTGASSTTGAWLSSGTLEHAASVAAATAARRWRWSVFTVVLLCCRGMRRDAVSARRDPTPARGDRPSAMAGEP